MKTDLKFKAGEVPPSETLASQSSFGNWKLVSDHPGALRLRHSCSSQAFCSDGEPYHRFVVLFCSRCTPLLKVHLTYTRCPFYIGLVQRSAVFISHNTGLHKFFTKPLPVPITQSKFTDCSPVRQSSIPLMHLKSIFLIITPFCHSLHMRISHHLCIHRSN